MVKRTAPTRVISFLLVAACGAFCQSLPSADLPQGLHFDGSNSPEVQRQETRTWRSLPGRPSGTASKTSREVSNVGRGGAHAFNPWRGWHQHGSHAYNRTAPCHFRAAGQLDSSHRAVVTPKPVPTFFVQVLYPCRSSQGALSPFERRQLYGPGHVRGFADFYHA